MKFLEMNVTVMDCMVVSIYNSIIAKGDKTDYEKVKGICTLMGWYNEIDGFKDRFLPTALLYFGITCKPAKKVSEIKKLSAKIRRGNNVILILKPTGCKWGHSTFAMKGKKGVKAYNSYHSDFKRGWKTLCRQFKWGLFEMYEIEVA